jgi:hypothetical protein
MSETALLLALPEIVEVIPSIEVDDYNPPIYISSDSETESDDEVEVPEEDPFVSHDGLKTTYVEDPTLVYESEEESDEYLSAGKNAINPIVVYRTERRIRRIPPCWQ